MGRLDCRTRGKYSNGQWHGTQIQQQKRKSSRHYNNSIMDEYQTNDIINIQYKCLQHRLNKYMNNNINKYTDSIQYHREIFCIRLCYYANCLVMVIIHIIVVKCLEYVGIFWNTEYKQSLGEMLTDMNIIRQGLFESIWNDLLFVYLERYLIDSNVPFKITAQKSLQVHQEMIKMSKISNLEQL